MRTTRERPLPALLAIGAVVLFLCVLMAWVRPGRDRSSAPAPGPTAQSVPPRS